MKKNDLLNLAQKAMRETNTNGDDTLTPCMVHFIERFGLLVARAEREACASLCDDRVTAYQYATDHWAQEHIDEARHLAAAIRARGEPATTSSASQKRLDKA